MILSYESVLVNIYNISPIPPLGINCAKISQILLCKPGLLHPPQHFQTFLSIFHQSLIHQTSLTNVNQLCE